MTDIATNLNTIDGSLSDIKTAIVNKGGTVSGNITTFATAIDNIPSGGGSTGKYALLDRVTDDNNNEIGTVSGFFTDANDVEYAVVCLDAQYRNDYTQYCSSSSSSMVVTNLPVYSDLYSSNVYIAKETATYNTQKILDYCSTRGYNSSACTHCRSKFFTIGGVVYYGQLPNVTEMYEILKNYTTINSLDTTSSSYGSLNFSTSRDIWTSSQSNGGNGWFVFSNCRITPSYLNRNAFACPVLEIPNAL